MKKLLIAAVMAAFAGGSAQAASTGEIDFNGELVANTCDVVVDNQGANASVELPHIGTSELTTAGDTAGEVSFNMALTNCSGTLTTVAAYFDNGATVDTEGRLINQSSGGADNVVLELMDHTNNAAGTAADRPIVVGNATDQTANSHFAPIDSTTATLKYGVRYYALGATTAGLVSSSVLYSLMYK